MYRATHGRQNVCGAVPMYNTGRGQRNAGHSHSQSEGGTGQDTLSINLASAFAELYPTLLMDADPQGSAQDWADSRTTGQLNLDACGVEPSRLLRDVRSLAPNYAWIIIDGPPGNRKGQRGRRTSR